MKGKVIIVQTVTTVRRKPVVPGTYRKLVTITYEPTNPNRS